MTRNWLHDGEWLFALLLAGVLLKATQFVPDIYLLRGATQGLCLAAALFWVFRHSVPAILYSYWPFFAYVAVLGLTALGSSSPFYVMFQTISLLAVILFSVAMTEARFDPHRLDMISAVCLALVCGGSVIYLIASPNQAYLHQVFGSRFRGILGQPGALAAIAGTLLGLTLFARRLNRAARAMLLFISVFCLYLTGSRTFWVASAVSLATTAVAYGWRKLLVSTVGVLLAMAVLAYVLSDPAAIGEGLGRITRVESADTLTGRTFLWQLALERFWNRPLLGYGFALAADAFHVQPPPVGTTLGITGWREEWFTMHNGYIQALLDSGLLGATLYTAIIVLALIRMIKYDYRRSYPAIFYVLLYFTVANLGESVILAAGVFPSVYYWYLAVFAVGINRHSNTTRFGPPRQRASFLVETSGASRSRPKSESKTDPAMS